MFEMKCRFCGETNIIPNVVKCPYCNKDMSDYTDELTKKHIQKCAYYLSPYKYSDRKPGRPKSVEVIETLGLNQF